MDLGTILGLVLCFAAICMSIMSNSVSDINSFIDIPSLGIVLGGTILSLIHISEPTRPY